MIEIAVLLALVLLVMELLLAFVFIPSRHGHHYYILKSKFSVYRYDRLTGYRMTPCLTYSNSRKSYPNAPRKRDFVDVRTDRNGFILTEDIEALRVRQKLLFCVGGSTTAGMESAHQKTYPAQLDKLIQPLGYRGINAGLGGGRSIHELLILKNVILKYKPAAVVIFSGYNDYEAYAYKVYAPANPYVHYLSPVLATNALESILSWSCLYFLAKRHFGLKSNVMANDVQSFQEALQKPLWLEEWKDNMRQMVDICRENDIKCFVLSTMSPVYQNASPEAKQFADSDLDMCGRFDQWVQFADIINGAAEGLCKEGKAQFIDVRPFFEKYLSNFKNVDYFKERFLLFVDRAHFSEKGNQLLAQAVYEQIKERL